MSVNTYLLDFTVSESVVGNTSQRHELLDNLEVVLKEKLPGLKRETLLELDEGFLLLLIAPRGILVTVRGYKQGVVTVNIELFRNDGDEPLLPLDTLRSLQSVFERKLAAERPHALPPIKRAGAIDRFFLTADERILEYDIDKVLFEEQSLYQKVQIIHSKSLGNLLVLDELQNMSESDLIYTETLMQRGVQDYTDKEVIILGGGDGCLLWELLKENPKHVTMLELDEVVMKACSKYLRSSCGNCLDQYKGDRYEIIVGDCFVTLDKLINDGKKVDFVFGDLTDIPVDSSGEQEMWDFIRLILNKSLQVLRPGGKFLTHGNGSSVPKSLLAYERLLKTLKSPVEFTKTHAFIPSFLEDWVFYQITPQLT